MNNPSDRRPFRNSQIVVNKENSKILEVVQYLSKDSVEVFDIDDECPHVYREDALVDLFDGRVWTIDIEHIRNHVEGERVARMGPEELQDYIDSYYADQEPPPDMVDA